MHISAIMAVYNCEAYVDDAIASIVSQSYQDWDLIIVDDGSTDMTPDLIAAWARRDARISVFFREHSGACGAPRNFGLSKATGEIIAVVDGDDFTHPERFERIVQIFQEYPNADAVYHDYVRFESGSPTFAEPAVQKAHRYVERAMKFGALVPCNSVLYQSTKLFRVFLATTGTGMTQGSLAFRRQMLENFVSDIFRTDLPTFQDVEFYLRLSKHGLFLFLDEVLFAYRRTPGSNLNSVRARDHAKRIFQVKSPVLREVERCIAGVGLGRLREHLAEGWRSIGWTAARAGLTARATECYLESLRLSRIPRRRASDAIEIIRLVARRFATSLLPSIEDSTMRKD